jgi:hypothetical protein
VDEPTGHTIDGTPWEEPRGPHLPDRLTAIPLLCWPFIALAIVQLAVGVSDIRSLGELDVSFALSWVAGRISGLAPTLMGVALFWRHPAAARSMPMVAWAMVLFAVGGVLALFSSPLSPMLSELTPPSDASSPIGWAFVGWQVGSSIVAVLAVACLGVGLDRARARRDALPRSLMALVVVLATLSALSYIPLLGGSASGAEMVANAIVAVATSTATLLLIGFVFVVAFVGRRSGEAPATGWAAAALGAGILVAASVLFQLIGLVYMLTGLVPFAVVTGASAVGWVLLLAAFAVGLPAEFGTAAADVPGPDPVTPDPPAATPPGSEGS